MREFLDPYQLLLLLLRRRRLLLLLLPRLYSGTNMYKWTYNQTAQKPAPVCIGGGSNMDMGQALQAWTIRQRTSSGPTNRGFGTLPGLEKIRLGMHQGAIEDYDKTIDLDPLSPTAFSNRAFAKRELGMHQAAILDYDKAIELEPSFAVAFCNRAFSKIRRDWTGRPIHRLDDPAQDLYGCVFLMGKRQPIVLFLFFVFDVSRTRRMQWSPSPTNGS